MVRSEIIAAGADDAALMRAIAERRDRAAFATVFGRYAPRLKAFLVHGGLQSAVAEELVQDIMLTVWQRADRYDPALGGLATWIFAIARNRRIDHFRRTQRLPEEPGDPDLEPDPELAADGLVERQNSHMSLRTALKALPPEQADVLRLAFYEQKSHAVIALERQLPLGTVKSRIRLALRHLRRSPEAAP